MTIKDLIEKYNHPYATPLLLMLLTADVIFCILSVTGALTPYFSSNLFSIAIDESYPEMYQYLKWWWIFLLLVYISVRRRSFGFIAIGLVFFYMILDDSLKFHEHAGNYFSSQKDFAAPFGLSSQDFGELLESSVAGMILFPVIIISYFRGDNEFRRTASDILILFILLILFGFVLEFGKHLFHTGDRFHLFLTYVEESGEMVSGSMILWYVFLCSGERKNERPSFLVFLCSIFRKKLPDSEQAVSREL